jgi:hypothetical protein
MMPNYFYTLPIYRVPYKKWCQEKDTYINTRLEEIFDTKSGWVERPTSDHIKKVTEDINSRYFLKYGPWKFNEIIGYIELYAYFNQIHGEHYCVEGKLYKGTKNPIRYQHCTVTYKEIITNHSNQEIYKFILIYINRCKKALKNRFLDDSEFIRIGPYMNWIKIIEEQNKVD